MTENADSAPRGQPSPRGGIAHRGAESAAGRSAKRSKGRRRRVSRAQERGAALIMVLGSLAILAIMLSEFQDEMSTEFGSAMSDRDALKAEYAARSAVNLSRLLIASEPTVRSAASILMMALSKGKKPPQIPVWQFAPQILGAFNDEEGAAQFKALANADIGAGEGLGLEGAGFRIQIIDEDSKINLNSAGRGTFGEVNVAQQIMGLIGGPQYDPMFEQRDSEGDLTRREDVCAAMIDWADANQDRTDCSNAASAQTQPPEDAYYRNLDVPYDRKNAPYDSLDELRLVRGVGDDFWATFIDPRPEDPASRPVTIWGQGKININTASPMTVLAQACAWALPQTPLCSDATGELPRTFLMMMGLAQGMFSGIPIFQSPKQLREALEGKGALKEHFESAGIPPIEFSRPGEFEKGLTLESKVFSIHAEGYVRQGQRQTVVRIMAVVDFRAAPTVEDLAKKMLAAATNQEQGSTGGAAEPEDSKIEAALTPSTAGRVVYYRVN